MSYGWPLSLILFFLLSWNLFAQQELKTSYTMADLEILAKNRDYRQFLDHANTLRPAERRAPWGELVSEMASGMAQFVLARQDFATETFNYLLDLTTWPNLREDEFFHLRWQRYGLSWIEKCFKDPQKKNRPICLEKLDRLWASTLPRPEFGRQIARLLSEKDPSRDLWPYLRTGAISEAASPFHCQEELLKTAAIKHFHLYVQRESPSLGNLKSYLRAELSADCWELLSVDLRRTLKGEFITAKSAYQILEAKGELNQRESDLFLVRYFMEVPVPGRFLNLSWALIKKLSTDFTRRKAVLEELAALDPLPGRIFSSSNQENLRRVQTFLNHLKQHFPEYIDLYTRTCLDFYEGNRNFPRGNPTLECREFISFDQKNEGKWIEQGLRLRISAQQKYLSPIRNERDH